MGQRKLGGRRWKSDQDERTNRVRCEVRGGGRGGQRYFDGLRELGMINGDKGCGHKVKSATRISR